MTRYLVRMWVRGHAIVAASFLTVDEAADYIVRHDSPSGWTIVAQEANRITPTTPQRDLRPTEWARAAKRGFSRPYDPMASQIRRAGEV